MRSRSGWIRALALAATGVLVLAGCAAEVRSSVAPPGAAQVPCGDLRIAVNPWVGYEANVAVVSYLAKNQLGCTVEERDMTEEDAWTALAAGEIDVILENWGHDDLKKRYIDDEKVAVEHGITGNRGIIGWYIPPWMVDAYPGITDWRKLNDYAHLFRTPQSDGKGQFLAGDPSYVTNDEALVRNLKLDFKVVFAGSEDALIDQFRRAEEERTPLIGYFYAPQWFLSEVELVHIKLPPYTPGCDADPKKVACDYQPYDLDKVLNRSFANSGSTAVTLLRNFQWTNADQNTVASYLTSGMSRDAAAKRWLDANPEAWADWLPEQ
ncbi:ABC transporter substrate-binding protein [Micromonospora sp. NPDC049891]|uniref:ABC transporter substrate-binding protein n=1 Tax=Micromonospora sp. NPDC049891 TaxID=3155655 RepID=UPI0033FF28F6